MVLYWIPRPALLASETRGPVDRQGQPWPGHGPPWDSDKEACDRMQQLFFGTSPHLSPRVQVTLVSARASPRVMSVVARR